MYRKLLLSLMATSALIVGFAGAASAAVPSDETFVGGTVNQLRTRSFNADGTRSTCSFIKAVNERRLGGSDSPLDAATNHHDFQAHICTGGWIEVYTQASLNNLTGMKVGDLKNVGVDFQTADITGAGQVYIAVQLVGGGTLFLDPTYCSHPIDGVWSTTDFDTAGAGCTIFDSAGTAYISTATQSALQVYQAAHPTATVDYTFLLVSAAPTDHTIHLDRIELGTGWSYDYTKLYAKHLAA